MTDNYYPHIDLFGESQKKYHETSIDLYESSVSCNRCGACARLCPSYQVYKFENYSPRGRNQLLRLIFESKIKMNKNKKDILKSALSCIECGRCTALCSACTPTALHMRELKRTLRPTRNSSLTNLFITFYKTYYFFKTLFIKLPKLDKEALPAAVYIPNVRSLKLMAGTINLIQEKIGPAVVLKRGLLLSKTAVTGTLPERKELLKKIRQEFNYKSQEKEIPLIVDSIEDYVLLKESEDFKNIKLMFITEITKDLPKTTNFENKKVVLMYNNMFWLYPENNSEIRSLFNCENNHFFVQLDKEYIPSLGLLPYVNVPGKKLLNNLILERIKKVSPDTIVTLSAYDYFYIKDLLGKDTKIQLLNITDFLREFYDGTGKTQIRDAS